MSLTDVVLKKQFAGRSSMSRKMDNHGPCVEDSLRQVRGANRGAMVQQEVITGAGQLQPGLDIAQLSAEPQARGIARVSCHE